MSVCNPRTQTSVDHVDDVCKGKTVISKWEGVTCVEVFVCNCHNAKEKGRLFKNTNRYTYKYASKAKGVQCRSLPHRAAAVAAAATPEAAVVAASMPSEAEADEAEADVAPIHTNAVAATSSMPARRSAPGAGAAYHRK
eukprot:357597-Chlamydomonas_euryale.AAC.6